MLTRRQIGLILIITSIFLLTVNFLMIGRKWEHARYRYPYWLEKSIWKFLFLEILRSNWTLFCIFLAFVGILLIIIHKKPTPSLEEKKSNLKEEK